MKKNATILIVDDTPANIDVLQKHLENEGFGISVATDGELALKIVTRARPDLILLDVMMPGLDGFEVCKRLQCDEANRDIPVIFLTARTESEDIVQGFEVGGADYVCKPFKRTELLARVRSHLKIRTLLREKQQLVERLETASRTDPLTGLSNRRHMTEKLEYEKVRAERKSSDIGIILGDIDDFKKINDSRGHDAGDRVLVEVSAQLKSHLRKQDTICRWGGEEFLLLLPDTNLQGASSLAEKLRHAVQSLEIHFDGSRIPVTMSFGVYSSKSAVESADQWIHVADENLYKAKAGGRNRVEPPVA